MQIASEQSANDPNAAKVSCSDLCVNFGETKAIENISMDIPDQSVTAIIGPSGCGKSTFLRCINRMNEVIDSASTTGTVLIDGVNVYAPDTDPVTLRSKVGMVFQKPNPFPKSIFDNVAYGLRIHGLAVDRTDQEELVKLSLQRAGLWDEVKNRLDSLGTSLSGGQQQRLCMARAIAINPEIILMDEPCSSLDPIATARIEELIDELKRSYCIVVVTHSMQQAARVSSQTAFFDRGTLVEFGRTEDVFTNPANQQTLDYITGRYA